MDTRLEKLLDQTTEVFDCPSCGLVAFYSSPVRPEDSVLVCAGRVEVRRVVYQGAEVEGMSVTFENNFSPCNTELRRIYP